MQSSSTLNKTLRLVFSKAHHTRRVAPLALAAALATLGACSLPANEDMVPMHDDPQRFAQAHAMCWEKSMGSNYSGGSAQFGSEMNLYNSCMEQTGWTHSKYMFSVAGPI
jgi:hypothetical protein